MPNIKNLEMVAAISATGCIAIRKSLFGLLQYAVYEPTQSKVKCIIQDYSPAEGDKLLRLLNMPIDKLQKELQTAAKPQKTEVGHYRLECCMSDDRQFCAMQLFRFVDFVYTPTTNLLTYRGSDVEVICQIL